MDSTNPPDLHAARPRAVPEIVQLPTVLPVFGTSAKCHRFIRSIVSLAFIRVQINPQQNELVL